jgi:hypothetical protein
MADKKKGLVVAVGIGKTKGPPPEPPPGDIPLDMGDTGDEDIALPDEPDTTDEADTGAPPLDEGGDYEEGAYPEFTIPEGLDLADLNPGEEKEVLCVIQKKDDGTACFTQVDGVDLAGTPLGMGGPPPAMPPPPPPPPGAMPMGPGGPPMPMGPPPAPGGSVRDRAAAMGLM